jgi:predicted kinase
MKQKIILTRGIPGSGKTYWAQGFIKENANFVNLNRDDLRLELFHKLNIKISQEKQVTENQLLRAKQAIREKRSIIISDTNLNLKTQEKWKKFAAENNLEFEFKDFLDVPFEVCLEQDKERDRQVGRDVILYFHNKYIVPTLPKHNNNKIDKQSCYIVDIDGTVALMNGRGPYDYTQVLTDIANEKVLNVVLTLSSLAKIIFVSGREAICQRDTILWLDKHCPFDYELFMRGEGDKRPDYIVKNEIFTTYINDNYNVEAVFDDRDQVVKMWRDWGLAVFQVNWGDF